MFLVIKLNHFLSNWGRNIYIIDKHEWCVFNDSFLLSCKIEGRSYGTIDCYSVRYFNSKLDEWSNMVYLNLFSIKGLWLTGVSKIAHLINDRLFIMINSDIASHFRLLGEERSLLEWLVIVQNNARAVYDDFSKLDLEGTPEDFLSQKLGYTKQGCQKSIIKYIGISINSQNT